MNKRLETHDYRAEKYHKEITHWNPGTLNLSLLLSPEKEVAFCVALIDALCSTHNPSFTVLITWALCTFRVSPVHFLPIVFIHSCTIILVFPPSALFLTTLIFNMNIREAWFQVCSTLAHWKSLLFMASSLDHSKTGFIFKVPHCTLLALQYLLAIRHQQDRTHKKKKKNTQTFSFPLSVFSLSQVWNDLREGFFFPFLLCLKLAAIRHLFGFQHFPVGLSWRNLQLSSSTFYVSKKPLLRGEMGLWLKNNRLYILRILSFGWN